MGGALMSDLKDTGGPLVAIAAAIAAMIILLLV
jgi:hypothetical protein